MKIPSYIPTEIIYNEIIPYTYNIQNKYLLDDILNFHKTKQELLNMYSDNETKYIEILSDLSYYMRSQFFEHCIQTRFFTFKYIPYHVLIHFMMLNYSEYREINTRIGFMLPFERNLLIETIFLNKIDF